MRTEDIIQQIHENNIRVYHAMVGADLINNGIRFIDLNDLITFARETDVQSMFLYELYDSIEEYYISVSDVTAISNYASQIMKDEISEYNENLENIDFDVPTMIAVACSVQGIIYYTIFENELLLKGEPLVPAKKKIQELQKKYQEEILNKQKERNKEIQDLKSKLKRIVLADEEFHRCTTKHLRFRYLSNLYFYELDDSFPELKQYWTSPGSAIFTKDAEDFIELTWREFKAR